MVKAVRGRCVALNQAQHHTQGYDQFQHLELDFDYIRISKITRD